MRQSAPLYTAFLKTFAAFITSAQSSGLPTPFFFPNFISLDLHPIHRVPKISKTALGAVESVPWSYHRKPLEALEEMKSRGIKFVLLEQTKESIPLWELSVDIFPACIAVGNEIGGITKDVVDAADIAVEIPMSGVKHSLNVAVAYGIAVYRLFEMYSEGIQKSNVKNQNSNSIIKSE